MLCDGSQAPRGKEICCQLYNEFTAELGPSGSCLGVERNTSWSMRKTNLSSTGDYRAIGPICQFPLLLHSLPLPLLPKLPKDPFSWQQLVEEWAGQLQEPRVIAYNESSHGLCSWETVYSWGCA